MVHLMKNDCYRGQKNHRNRIVFPLCILMYSVAEIEQIQASNRLHTTSQDARDRYVLVLYSVLPLST